MKYIYVFIHSFIHPHQTSSSQKTDLPFLQRFVYGTLLFFSDINAQKGLGVASGQTRAKTTNKRKLSKILTYQFKNK